MTEMKYKLGTHLELDRDCDLGQKGEVARVDAINSRSMTIVFMNRRRGGPERIVQTGVDYRYFHVVENVSLGNAPTPVVRDCMDLEALLAALMPIRTGAFHVTDNGDVLIPMTADQRNAAALAVQSIELADLVNYKNAIASFPRLLQALKLVMAIADNPMANPDDRISLSTKTRNQIESALKFAEKP